MSVVIGAGTTVSFQGACVISANWGLNPNTQRLYCIGEWSPTVSYNRPIETLSLTVYSGATSSHDITASVSCTTVDTLSASLDPAICGDSVDGPASTSWFLVNYGFSKDDPLLPGQETWGMQQWVQVDAEALPTYVLGGISEGSAATGGNDADAGIEFTGDLVESTQGSVSANSIGRADTLTLGVVIGVGGSESPASGKTGQGSVSRPLNPLWVG